MKEKYKSEGVYISTYGCQMNTYDTERMYNILEMHNYFQVKTPEEASLLIINSCSVREKPVHKVHSELGRFRKLKKTRPYLKIGVGGCVAQQEKQRLLKQIPCLDFVFGTDAIDLLPQIVHNVRTNSKRVVSTQFSKSSLFQSDIVHENIIPCSPGVSTFVNITKGCNNFCTFCIVPFTRGREKSRFLNTLLDEIKILVSRGVKEVTLLGQNVNSYKSICGANFSTLLKAICEDTDITRVRFTTSHPKDFDKELVTLMKEFSSKICSWIHLPLQSGNSEILKQMNRGYSREEYINKINMIIAEIPDISLSTDIIVGFPGESDCAFEDTLSLIETIPFEYLFAFKYSPRPFTKAAKFSNQISEVVKSKRLDHLLNFHRACSEKLAIRYLDQVLDVLVDEEEENGFFSGRISQNKRVYFNSSTCHIGDVVKVGDMVKVKIQKTGSQNLRGEIVL